MEASGYQAEIIVVDDNSPDGTGKVVRDSYVGDHRVDLVCRTGERCLAQAVAEGFQRARYERYAVIDADLQHPPERLPALIDALHSGADIAIGSRYVTGGDIEDWSGYRRVVSRVGAWFTRLTNPKLRDIADPLSGFFALDHSVIEDIELTPCGYKILLEILVKGSYDRIKEVPYVFSQRESGNSNLTISRYMDFLKHVLMLRNCNSPGQLQSESGPDTVVSEQNADTPRRCETPPDIALVTPYPPARDGVADYGKKLIEGYQSEAGSTIILGSGAGTIEHVDDDSIHSQHTWEKDNLRGILSLARRLWNVRRDVELVHFNIKPTYFGSRNLLRFLSLLLPLFARLVPGLNAVVTMHDILEGVDADNIGEQVGILEQAGCVLATQLVLCSGPVTVTTAEYRELLESKYPFGTVRHVPHGTTQANVSATGSTDTFCLLLFGYISPYKDYRTVFEAFERLRSRHDDIELWVVGDSHPNHTTYAERLRVEYADTDGIRFFDYVDECDLPQIFDQVNLLVLPYKTAPGVSGPYQEAKAYGLPVVVYDDEDVLRATAATGGEVVTTPPGDAESLATLIEQLINTPEALQRMGVMNRDAVGPDMAHIVGQILDIGR